jgi:lipopolysaccharide export system ATP-binding protein
VGEGHIIAAGSAEDILANQRVREVYLGDQFRM